MFRHFGDIMKPLSRNGNKIMRVQKELKYSNFVNTARHRLEHGLNLFADSKAAGSKATLKLPTLEVC